MSALGVLGFAVPVAALAWIYLGYPLLLVVRARLRPRPIEWRGIEPSVSVLVAAHDEEDVIGAKIDNILALQYPRDRLEVIIVSDGSTDRTNDIARGYADRGVRLIAIPRAGKAAALNLGASAARGEYLVLTDADVMLAPESLRFLMGNFADAEVGAVCSNKRYRRPGGGDPVEEEGEGLYWRFETWLKRLESASGSAFASDGALHALRRVFYEPIENPAQADDMAISMRVVLRGYRLVFEPRALVFEECPGGERDEFRRKIRVTNHSLHALLDLGPALWRSGFYSVELLSHKLFRHLTPFFMIPLFGSTAALAGRHPLFLVVLFAQVVFYALALTGFVLRQSRSGRHRLLYVPYYFCFIQSAAFLGVLSVVRGAHFTAWRPRGGLPDPVAEEGVAARHV